MFANACVRWEAGLSICIQQAEEGAVVIVTEIRMQWTSILILSPGVAASGSSPSAYFSF